MALRSLVSLFSFVASSSTKGRLGRVWSCSLYAFTLAAVHSAVATREAVHPSPSVFAISRQLLFNVMYVDNVYVRLGKKHSMTSSYMYAKRSGCTKVSIALAVAGPTPFRFINSCNAFLVGNHEEPLGTIGNHREPLRTIGNHRGRIAILEGLSTRSFLHSRRSEIVAAGHGPSLEPFSIKPRPSPDLIKPRPSPELRALGR